MRYLAAAERSWHKAIQQLRAVQKERRATQPAETETLNPSGSVSQNTPQRPAGPPQTGYVMGSQRTTDSPAPASRRPSPNPARVPPHHGLVGPA
jgi:hypothetical protein